MGSSRERRGSIRSPCPGLPMCHHVDALHALVFLLCFVVHTRVDTVLFLFWCVSFLLHQSKPYVLPVPAYHSLSHIPPPFGRFTHLQHFPTQVRGTHFTTFCDKTVIRIIMRVPGPAFIRFRLLRLLRPAPIAH